MENQNQPSNADLQRQLDQVQDQLSVLEAMVQTIVDYIEQGKATQRR